jgi:cell division protein FtsW (lipid II flippase)
MWSFLRRQALYFLVGFVVSFIIYLFVRFDFDKIILGVVIGAGVGLAVSIGVFMLERRFPDRSEAS